MPRYEREGMRVGCRPLGKHVHLWIFAIIQMLSFDYTNEPDHHLHPLSELQ